MEVSSQYYALAALLQQKDLHACKISGFHYNVDETCALLGYYICRMVIPY